MSSEKQEVREAITHRKSSHSSLESNRPFCSQPSQSMTSKEQDTTYEGIRLILDEVVVSEEVDVAGCRI